MPYKCYGSKYEENGITLNKFFSIGMAEGLKMAKFGDNPYDTIVFDEIFSCNTTSRTYRGSRGIARTTLRRSSE